MAVLYGFKKFREMTAARITLSAKPTLTNAAGATDNPGYTSIIGLGRKDVGSIMDVIVATMVGTVAAAKPTSFTTGHNYYIIKEVPTPESTTDFSFVGIPLETMADVDNLEAVTYKGDWASQYYKLKIGGAR